MSKIYKLYQMDVDVILSVSGRNNETAPKYANAANVGKAITSRDRLTSPTPTAGPTFMFTHGGTMNSVVGASTSCTTPDDLRLPMFSSTSPVSFSIQTLRNEPATSPGLDSIGLKRKHPDDTTAANDFTPYKNFMQWHSGLADDSKHRFASSVRYAEDWLNDYIVRKFGGPKPLSYEAFYDYLPLSGFLVLEEEVLDDIFSPLKQEELLDNIKKLEKIPESLEKYIDFLDTKHDEVYDKRLEAVISGDVQFGRKLDGFRRRWLTGGIEKWQINARNACMVGESPDAWWAMNLWGYIFDSTLQMTLGLKSERESCCAAGSEEKEDTMTDGKKAPNKEAGHGSRIDAIITYEGRHELGAVEAAKNQSRPFHGTEVTQDRLKLCRTMHSMLRALEEEFGSDFMREKQIQVIGTIEQGLRWDVYGLQQIGSMCYLYRHRRHAISLYREKISSFLAAMKSMASLQKTMETTTKEINRLPPNLGYKKRRTLAPVAKLNTIDEE
ncbi:MAG: hypothetical protein Q9213_007931 [Squamulea squamosa]